MCGIQGGQLKRVLAQEGKEFVDKVDIDLEADAPFLWGCFGTEGRAVHGVGVGPDDGDTGGGDVVMNVHLVADFLEVRLPQENAGDGGNAGETCESRGGG